MLDRITPLILTLNEAPNIGRTLESLAWAKRVVVLDSQSTDETQAIVARFPNAALLVRKFDRLATQWNFGLAETGISTDWILALDADYGMPPAFAEELARLDPPADIGGYRATFRYCIEGSPLRGALYPPVVVLFRRKGAVFAQDGHAHRIQVQGDIGAFSTPLLHDDRKSLAQWFSSQVKYMTLEAEKLRVASFKSLRWPDRIRKLVVVAPAAAFFYCLIVKGNLLDGRRGLVYAMQRATAEAILSLLLLEASLRPRDADGD